MNKHLVRQHPAPRTPAGVAQLQADATNWRTLLTEIAARGFADMNVTTIARCFLNFREMARSLPAIDTQPDLPPPPDPLLDAVRSYASPLGPGDLMSAGYLAPDPAAPYQTPLVTVKRLDIATIRAMHRTPPVDVRDFAEAETRLGYVLIGYTETGMLAFTFARTNEVYLVPITNVLAKLLTRIPPPQPRWLDTPTSRTVM